MKTVEIESFSQFYETIMSRIGEIVIYRGVSSVGHSLVPKVGRVNLRRTARKRLEKERASFQTFKNHGRFLLERDPIDDWDWMSIAQHHGVSTRLLDWSQNPLVAAYFALRKRKQPEDSCIYAYKCMRNGKDIVSFDDYPDPFSVTKVFRVIPRHATRRIVAQSGLFTIHPNPGEEFKSDRIQKYIIRRSFVRDLRDMVRKFGMTPFSLFPDLPGLSIYVNELNDR